MAFSLKETLSNRVAREKVFIVKHQALGENENIVSFLTKLMGAITLLQCSYYGDETHQGSPWNTGKVHYFYFPNTLLS